MAADKLDEIAERLHEAPYSEIRAALEALVREIADHRRRYDESSWALLRRYGLKEER